MKKDKVIFKQFDDGDIIALFPEMIEGNGINSYMHVGQHSSANPDLIEELDDAKLNGYYPLWVELKSIGYKLEVLNKDANYWKARVRKVYYSLEELIGYDETFNIAERLGYSSCESLWKENPVIGGSVNPEDFCVMRK